jgi:palmitoyltransferase
MEESQGQPGFLQVVPETSVPIPHDTESRNASVLTQFFINFLTWSTIYTIYVFVVLVCKLSQGGSADGQMIGIAALSVLHESKRTGNIFAYRLLCICGIPHRSGFFTLFTASMLLSHMQLIAVGMTTIESFSMRSQLDRERAFLTRQFGVCGWTRKRKAMKTWGREWGDLKDEGNRWFLGPGPFDEWKRVMGDSPVGWIRE